MDSYQYQDLPQIPTMGDEQDIPFYWPNRQFNQMQASNLTVGRMFSPSRTSFDFDGFNSQTNPLMQPMQRFLHGMDPAPFASGFSPASNDHGMSLQPPYSKTYDRPWPSIDSLPYSPRNGSPDRTSVSGTSSYANQSDTRSPLPVYSSSYANHTDNSQARLSYPSPEAFPPELTLAGSSINLRDLELHHEELEPPIEEHEHIECKSEYEPDSVYPEQDVASDNYQNYPTPGLSNGMRDAQSVEPIVPTDESDSDYKPSSPRSTKRRRSSTSSRNSGRTGQGRRGRKPSTNPISPRVTRIGKKGRGAATQLDSGKGEPLSAALSPGAGRPFPCPFAGYGCSSDFVSKNEWKRHGNTQHIKLGFWRCDLCATTVDPHDESTVYHNDFNRKDLFTQHLRRMHAAPPPPNRAARDIKEYPVTEENLNIHQKRCYRKLRENPPQSSCLFCEHKFKGLNSWDERMEHVGRHFEKDRKTISLDFATWNKDPELEQWLHEEGLIAQEGGEWKIGDGRPRRISQSDTEESEDLGA